MTDPIAPDWLVLRERADAVAREPALRTLIPPLLEHLASRGSRPPRVVDVGAGTGAGARWLRPHLPPDSGWRLVDHDPGLLALAEPGARTVRADVRDLPDLLAQEPADLVTCQALLDLLTAGDVESLVGAAAAGGAALLLGLTVTGEVRLTPSDPLDDALGDAFDAHQCREGRLGPGATAATLDSLRRNGYAATAVATQWRLAAQQSDLLLAWLDGRAAAAAEQEPARAEDFARWSAGRRDLAARGELTAVVGHVDVLGLPSSP